MDEQSIRNQMAHAVEEVRTACPLAGSITNNVTVDFVANAQLAAGGSAAMVYLADEAVALAQLGGAFYVNMGTLAPVLEESIPVVARFLHEAGKSWVLDPVGLGIGAMRARILQELRSCKPSIIRGNASEIIGLAGLWGLEGDALDAHRVRGVDTTDEVDVATAAAVALADFTGGAVAVSGEVDLITDGKTICLLQGGSPFMAKVTGCGCSLGGVMAVYSCVADPFIAALAAAALYDVAGARAEAQADAPGSFKVSFIDQIYKTTPEDVASNPFALKEV